MWSPQQPHVPFLYVAPHPLQPFRSGKVTRTSTGPLLANFLLVLIVLLRTSRGDPCLTRRFLAAGLGTHTCAFLVPFSPVNMWHPTERGETVTTLLCVQCMPKNSRLPDIGPSSVHGVTHAYFIIGGTTALSVLPCEAWPQWAPKSRRFLIGLPFPPFVRPNSCTNCFGHVTLV